MMRMPEQGDKRYPFSSNFTPQVGEIVALKGPKDTKVRPYRVLDVREREDSRHVTPTNPNGKRSMCHLRPMDMGLDMDDGATDHDVHGSFHGTYNVLPEHYAICRICGDLAPCEGHKIEKEWQDDDRIAEYFQTPGVCPICQEPVTHRQGSRTFDHNLFVPGGPPVTFHTRKKCASKYYPISIETYARRHQKTETTA